MLPEMVQAEDIGGEVVLRVSADRVDVVAVVLRVVVFHQQRRAVQPVVVPMALGRSARPCEMELFKVAQPLPCDALRESVRVVANQPSEQLPLAGGERFAGDPEWCVRPVGERSVSRRPRH